ncbi:MAG: 3-hydroxyacyl-ACP dehydratase FabZ [Gammaproteobacteria bacterium]|nr:3-hydroxyacyl-ACP dehydratase FabZ [Gammaproteobacteria bacterium]
MTDNDNTLGELDIREIMARLPHRYPFLLVDRVLSYEPARTLTAIKNVTYDEPCFTGHFPGLPIFPGVLIIEAMAQATGLLGALTMGDTSDSDSLYLLVGVDKVRFRRPVTPGDQLRIVVNVVNNKRGIWKFDARADVDGDSVCKGELMSAHRHVE